MASLFNSSYEYRGLVLASIFGSLVCLGTTDAFSTSKHQHHPRLLTTRNGMEYGRLGRPLCMSEIAHEDVDESSDVVDGDESILSGSTGFWTEDQPARPLHDSVYTQVLSTVLPELGSQLRQEYDNHFADPRQPDAARFAWDPWYVAVGDTGTKSETVVAEDPIPNGEDEMDTEGNGKEEMILVPGELEASKKQTQYSLKRIQTSQFFSAESYDLLLDNLMALGRSVGLHAITPPWTSMYTDGDQQNWHTDAPHGPLAFVLSICSDEQDFDGGETMLLQPQMLDFWKGFDSANGLECGSIVR